MSHSSAAAPATSYPAEEQKRVTEVIFGYARRIGELQDREYRTKNLSASRHSGSADNATQRMT